MSWTEMSHRSRVLKTRVLKSKSESLRLDFGTWRTPEPKKNRRWRTEEEQTWRRTNDLTAKNQRFDDEEQRNDLTTKNSDKEQRKNRSEWVIGRSKSDLHEELRRSWGRRSLSCPPASISFPCSSSSSSQQVIAFCQWRQRPRSWDRT